MNNIHIGTLPPPLGGISVYLYRLKRLQKGDEFIDLKNLTKRKLLYIVVFTNKEIVLHSKSWKILCMLWILSFFFGRKYIVVFHGMGWLLDIDCAGRVNKYLMLKSLDSCKKIRVVSEDIKEKLLNIKPQYKDKVFVENAFLPPPLEDEQKIWCTYPEDVKIFIKKQRPLVVANAFRLIDYNGTDLYGLDMCIELINRLKKQCNNVGLLFALADEQYRSDYFHEMKTLIVKYGLQGNIMFLTNQHELWPIIKHCDVMVRPTCTDGYPVSIAEALYFNHPVVTSDVVVRDKRCIVFKNRDIDDFTLKVESVLYGDL